MWYPTGQRFSRQRDFREPARTVAACDGLEDSDGKSTRRKSPAASDVEASIFRMAAKAKRSFCWAELSENMNDQQATRHNPCNRSDGRYTQSDGKYASFNPSIISRGRLACAIFKGGHLTSTGD